MQTQTTGVGTNLPKFKDVITIEIAVQMVYQKMLDTLPADYKHREILAHAIVGSANAKGQLSYIYNALAGFENTIDFKVGDDIRCTSEERRERYDYNLEDSEGEEKPDGIKKKTEQGADYKPNYSVRSVGIGRCEVIEVDMYSDKKLLVKFIQDKKYDNGKEEEEVWVDHRKCTKWYVNRPAVVETVAH